MLTCCSPYFKCISNTQRTPFNDPSIIEWSILSHRQRLMVALGSRLFPPPEFDTLKLPELKDHVQSYAQEINRAPTPFMSMTDDILRAINIAFCRHISKKDVAILLVDPWKLEAGSYLKCNAICSKIGIGHENIHNTEISQPPTRRQLVRSSQTL